jgi:hypothetical protein
MNGWSYPTMNHAGNYGGMLHYLGRGRAQTTDGIKVVAKMKELPTMTRPSARRVREGWAVSSPDVFVAGEEAGRKHGQMDYYKLAKTIPVEELAPARLRRRSSSARRRIEKRTFVRPEPNRPITIKNKNRNSGDPSSGIFSHRGSGGYRHAN